MLELAIVLAAAAIVTGAVIPSFVKSAYIDAARRAAVEVSQIQEASRSYYIKKRSWPPDLAALKAGGYLDNDWGGINPFGKPYWLEISGQILLVKTEAPKDMTGLMARALPMTSVSGQVVVSGVTVPGVDAGTLPIGAVIPWPGSEFPAGWTACDGRQLSRADHSELFTLLGITYGSGDGVTTFNLPDLRGRVVIGMDNIGGSVANIITGSWARQLGGKFGEEDHRLSIAEMPSHSHGYYETPWQGSRYDGHSSPVMTGQVASSTSPSGGGLAHNNIQPSMAMNWIIKG